MEPASLEAIIDAHWSHIGNATRENISRYEGKACVFHRKWRNPLPPIILSTCSERQVERSGFLADIAGLCLSYCYSTEPLGD